MYYLTPRSGTFNFYPRSPCGERHINYWTKIGNFSISIHALLAESDPFAASNGQKSAISIHALLAESDYTDSVPPASLKTFLSTLSLRRATV